MDKMFLPAFKEQQGSAYQGRVKTLTSASHPVGWTEHGLAGVTEKLVTSREDTRAKITMWSCETLNSTDNSEDQHLCQDFHFVLSIFSLLYLIICFPIGLCYNGLLVLVNLYNKATMTMPDVYFVNIAIAGLIINTLAPMYLLGLANTKWAIWNSNNEVYITLLILFNVSSLVTMYSTTLLSLDYYIERALPRTYMSSVYNTKHVCGFIWGGAMLTSFSSLLFYVCNHVSTKIIECSKMQNKEAADAIMVFIGYVVPAVAVLYALILILRIRKEATPLDQDTGRLDPSVHRLLIATVCTQFTLWTPYYITLLVSTFTYARGRPADENYSRILHFTKVLSKFLAFSSSFVMPLLYRYINKNFPNKLRRLLKKIHCGNQGCSHERTAVQQVMT
ncbi:probable G-protein coupled receptor 146 isoform X1 [Lagopus muta]|uniref:probable G-protein coupled receptor 146 isoform X1 n=2 Tax=Lagopus TaxID=30409 RepID=UPI00209E12F3|nr:probable G-protein coupled receptor 146 isoform X1 [Lagopus muta]XP_048817436.1 probable G-protein coupled receptor 146 isoform X1 [Lagopus muta]